MRKNILGVEIDNVNQTAALSQIEEWIWNPGPDSRQSRNRGSSTNEIRRDKHYIVTPNLEFIVAAQSDPEFKRILNNASLAIPDSSSLGFSYWLLKRNIFLRLLLWPLLFLPVKQLIQFERVAGTDLMEALCKLAEEKGFVVGFLGGGRGVAEKVAECLLRKYPGLKVDCVESGGKIFEDRKWKIEDSTVKIPPLDILFVAFGHIKQEKWIANNLDKIPVKLAMGVGGAFDYLSGNLPRAPKWLRALGFEWLFRLAVQPRRIKRQINLLKFIWFMLKWNNRRER